MKAGVSTRDEKWAAATDLVYILRKVRIAPEGNSIRLLWADLVAGDPSIAIRHIYQRGKESALKDVERMVRARMRHHFNIIPCRGGFDGAMHKEGHMGCVLCLRYAVRKGYMRLSGPWIFHSWDQWCWGKKE